MWAGTVDDMLLQNGGKLSRKLRKKRELRLSQKVMCQEPPDGLGEADAYRAMCSAIYDFLTWPIPAYAQKRGTGEKTKVPSARRRGISYMRWIRKQTR